MASLKKAPLARGGMPKPPTEARRKPPRLPSRVAGYQGRKRMKAARARK